jgi:hypothetical protein
VARLHGRNGTIYLGTYNGVAASLLAFAADWTLNFAVAKADVTAFGDINLIYVAGLPDASGDFSGFYDDATRQTYDAAQDGLNRNFYLYPNKNNLNQYFFGQILPDFSIAGGVAAAISFKSTWNANSPITKNG